MGEEPQGVSVTRIQQQAGSNSGTFCSGAGSWQFVVIVKQTFNTTSQTPEGFAECHGALNAANLNILINAGVEFCFVSHAFFLLCLRFT